MIIYDPDTIKTWLKEISLRPCDFSREEDYDEMMTEDLADGALELLGQIKPPKPLADRLRSICEEACTELIRKRKKPETIYQVRNNFRMLCDALTRQ